jgi:hypothetical protein
VVFFNTFRPLLHPRNGDFTPLMDRSKGFFLSAWRLESTTSPASGSERDIALWHSQGQF